MDQAANRTFRPRPFRRSFAHVPRHWFGGNATATHLVNALNLLFPTGERFFVKSVRKYEPVAEGDPELRAQIRAFYAQEGRHANAHERYFDRLREQGFAIDGIVDFATWLLHRSAPRTIPKAIRLSITVALEHYTAVMAQLALTDPYFERIEPTMQALLRWHAAEEIEHKAVAWDVLKRVDPSYSTRMAGFAIATIGLVPIWTVGAALLLRQDGVPLGRIARELLELSRHGILHEKIFWRAFRTYAPRDFHPLDPRASDDWPVAREHLERFEAELAAE